MHAAATQRFTPRVKILAAALLMAFVLFIALGLVAFKLGSIHDFSALAIVYRGLYAAFLLTLLVTTSAVGLAWSNRVGQKLEPVLATTALWFAFASILTGLFGVDVQSTWSETVWIAGLVAGTAGMAVALVAAVASSRKYTRKIG